MAGGVNLLNARRVLAMSVPYPRQSLNSDGVIGDQALRMPCNGSASIPGRDWECCMELGGVVAAAAREVRRRLAKRVTRLTFLSQASARRLATLASAVPFLRDRVGPKLRTLESALQLVGGRPNATALPLAYWKSGTRPAVGAPLDPAQDGCGLIWYAPLVEMTPAAVRSFVEHVTGVMTTTAASP